ncbi:hypothetical protein OUZ56_016152 [Daphnia magna]|uniref:Uncharacterized protein n=1 Tax=Daphnia magna TaxID=35525 RepID=A0ABR0APU0_9CRUS|nr:hypothetical protein OUZ56_016152 [Daphnia magna]
MTEEDCWHQLGGWCHQVQPAEIDKCAESSLKMFCTISQRLSLRCMSIRQEDTLPDLPYDFDELEPVISAEIKKGELLEAINKDYYGSLENMKNIFSSATVAIQGLVGESGASWQEGKFAIPNLEELCERENSVLY